MSKVQVITVGGFSQNINRVAIECPFCHSKMAPDYLFLDGGFLFAKCSNSECGRHMVLTQDSYGDFKIISPNALPEKNVFSKIIREVSQDFEKIYNQAFYAEQLSLDQICGVGYRKALEFLIKDFLMFENSDEEYKDTIKKKFLYSCIQEDVSDERIKEVAKRAVWLGNDETHYVRKWAKKDVSNLKDLINLTVRWIENEIETKRLLEEMPEYN